MLASAFVALVASAARGSARDVGAWGELSWCADDAAAQAGKQTSCGEKTAANRILAASQGGQFCERLTSPMPPCPDQIFGYLKMTPTSWTVTFPQCSTFMPAADGPQRNEYTILATSNVVGAVSTSALLDDADADAPPPALAVATDDSKPSRGADVFLGAVLLRFENTTSLDDSWAGMAKSHSCSISCLTESDEDNGNVRVSSLLVACPGEGGGRGATPRQEDLRQCGMQEGELLLVKENKDFEGRRCAWEPPEIAPPRVSRVGEITMRLSLLVGKYLLLGRGLLSAMPRDVAGGEADQDPRRVEL